MEPDLSSVFRKCFRSSGDWASILYPRSLSRLGDCGALVSSYVFARAFSSQRSVYFLDVGIVVLQKLPSLLRAPSSEFTFNACARPPPSRQLYVFLPSCVTRLQCPFFVSRRPTFFPLSSPAVRDGNFLPATRHSPACSPCVPSLRLELCEDIDPRLPSLLPLLSLVPWCKNTEPTVLASAISFPSPLLPFPLVPPFRTEHDPDQFFPASSLSSSFFFSVFPHRERRILLLLGRGRQPFALTLEESLLL